MPPHDHLLDRACTADLGIVVSTLVPDLDSSAVHGRPDSAAVEFGGLGALRLDRMVYGIPPSSGQA